MADVQHICPNGHAFAAVKRNGSVVTWGYPRQGGDSTKVSEQLAENIHYIYSTFVISHYGAFAALKGDGSAVTWGNSKFGGDSAKVQAQLAADVQLICSTNFAFAALKGDGSVVCWGQSLWWWQHGFAGAVGRRCRSHFIQQLCLRSSESRWLRGHLGATKSVGVRW